MTARRARFWVFVNLDWVKLTLAPGESRSHVTGGRHEEGYSWTVETWDFDGQTVTREIDTTASDCDGKHYERDVEACALADLAARPASLQCGECGRVNVDANPCACLHSATWFMHTRIIPPSPAWTSLREYSRRRDYRAEAAGY